MRKLRPACSASCKDNFIHCWLLDANSYSQAVPAVDDRQDKVDDGVGAGADGDKRKEEVEYEDEGGA